MSAEEAILRSQTEGLTALLASAAEGSLVSSDEMLVVIHERLVQELIGSATPFEREIAGRYRIRVTGASVSFADGFAMVRLDGRASLLEEDTFANVVIFAGLDVVELEPTFGMLRLRLKVFALDAPLLRVAGLEPPAKRLLQALGRERLDSFAVLLQDVEIPVRVEHPIALPRVRSDRVEIAAATIPFEARVSEVKVFSQKLWVSIRASLSDAPAPAVARASVGR